MQKRKWTVFQILELMIMAALLVFMIIMLTAGKTKIVPMEEIRTRMEAIPSVKELQKKEMSDAAKNFGVDAALMEEGIYYSVDDIMNVNELLIIRVEDEESRQKAIDAVEKYLAEKTASFDGYGTNQFGLLSSAVTTEKGTYFFFGVGEDVLEWETRFLKAIG